jgi:hypothetical protein
MNGSNVIQHADVLERRAQANDQRAKDLPHVQRYVETLSDEDRYRWEKACRYVASQTRRRLAKSYRRDPKHPEFGHYKLLNARKTASADGRRRGAKHFPGPWLTLAEVWVELCGADGKTPCAGPATSTWRGND